MYPSECGQLCFVFLSYPCIYMHTEILSSSVISISLGVCINSESLFGIHCSQVRQYYLTLPIEVQCSISVKAGKQQNASY